MNQLYADQSVSVTELKKNYATVVAQANGEPVVVLNNNRPEVYLVPAKAYEALMDYIEDLEDAEIVRQRINEPRIEVTLEDLRNGNI